MSTFRLFKTFLAVAQYGTFAAAAERVALTPAAVGLQMRALEDELRRTLFDRSHRNVRLSADGAALVPYARQLLRDYESMLGRQSQADTISGSVTIGGIVSAMGGLANSLVDLKIRYPALEIRLLVGHAGELPDMVLAGKVDAAIMVKDPAPVPPGVHWSWLYDEPLMLIASRRAAGPGADPLELLRTRPFLQFDRRTQTGAKVEQFLRRSNIAANVILEVNSLAAISELVRQDVGVAISPMLRHVDWQTDLGLRILPLPGRPQVRRIGIMERVERADVTAVVRKHLIERMRGGAARA
ncbi:LysR substrate-binding domain-containing protein [Achromobacter aloeverae]|uniref:LysR family transcriptional regulator n=1 Tax=Achromobacter aloeverae TaxID=1750518 RepID=A0A4V1MRQ0_9BURK|nr:LysR substrate-binding domain-containing protein [Achromobacter aloeverae]RXN85411.1 LysR family transcriptional regulator [Achromobacter aloeverae]